MSREIARGLPGMHGRTKGMNPFWKWLTGTQDIDDSRPWDLAERVPVFESRWFRISAVVIILIVLAMLFFFR